MINILQKEKASLREVSREVKIEEIGSASLNELLAKMKKALEEQEDGVAIAAPQVGENLRIFVMSKKVFDMKEGEPIQKEGESKFSDIVFINPKIKKLSREKEMMDEGCLSVRWLYGKVSRSTKAIVEALDQNGKKFTMGGSGIVAQVFQHETDHLDGLLFIDQAIDLEEIKPESESRSMNHELRK